MKAHVLQGACRKITRKVCDIQKSVILFTQFKGGGWLWL
jgi:hypothetical protein